MVFENREEAGNLLAQRIKLNSFLNTVILGIPRGGVMVAKIIAQKLNLPLDIIVVKKISAPKNPELAIGAVGPENSVYWDKDLCRRLSINKFQISNFKFQIEKERTQKERILRGGRSPIDVKNKLVFLVDDGVATGATAICASKFLKKEKAKEITLVTPVIAKETFDHLKKYFAKIVTLAVEKEFHAVGQFYKYFPQVEDEEVIKILDVRA